MIRRLVYMIIKIIFYCCLLFVAFLLTSRLITEIYSISRVYKVEEVPNNRIAIVFGAGLWSNGKPTPVLRDRVSTAADLFFSGKVEKLLMSGDNRYVEYNEPGAMRNFALELGIPDEVIVLDYAGRRTYDTCYRARVIFGLKEAILVTQKFHLPRALFTCNLIGIKSIGVSADQRKYSLHSLLYWHLREIPATVTAFWQVLVTHPLPVLGNIEPIFPPDL